MPANGLIYVVLPRATIGLSVADGRIQFAPPYACKLGWTPGRDAREVWREAARRAEHMEWLPAPDVGDVTNSPNNP